VKVHEVVSKYEAPDMRCEDAEDYSLLMRYLMSVVIFKHFQRPSVVAYMLMGEVVLATMSSDQHTIILVMDHKTSASGPAAVALEKEDFNLFQLFLRK